MTAINTLLNAWCVPGKVEILHDPKTEVSLLPPFYRKKASTVRG